MTSHNPPSDPGSNPEPHEEQLPGDDTGIEELLREVGARAEPGTQLMDEVRSVVHAEWLEVVQARRRRRRVVGFAMAACVGGVVAATLIGLRVSQPDSPMATIVRIEGSAQVGTGRQLHAGRSGEVLVSGMLLTTGADARVALSLSNAASSGISLRVDAGSQLQFVQPGQLQLQSGALYVDAGMADAYPLVVQTPAGTVRHLGTQYQVRTVGGGIELSIREGRVEIASDYGTHTGVAGEQLAVSMQGAVSRSALSSHDSSWQWAADVAPPFDIAGRSLSSFIEWVARETGRTVSYDTPAARRAAEALQLGGSITGLDPATALQAVLQTTKFKLVQPQDQTIHVAFK